MERGNQEKSGSQKGYQTESDLRVGLTGTDDLTELQPDSGTHPQNDLDFGLNLISTNIRLRSCGSKTEIKIHTQNAYLNKNGPHSVQ